MIVVEPPVEVGRQRVDRTARRHSECHVRRTDLRFANMLNFADDACLTARAANADPAAQKALVLRLMGRVQRLSRSLLRSAADASDASQVSMIQILKSAGNYRGEGTLESWADRIVFRTAMRFYGAQRRARGAGPPEDSVSFVRPISDPAVLVGEYLSWLSEPQQTVLLMRHVFGHTTDEIAEILGVSPNTVKDRLLRARATLRRLMRREQLVGGMRVREGGRAR